MGEKVERARMRRLARWLLPPVLLCAGYALWVGLTGRGRRAPSMRRLGSGARCAARPAWGWRCCGWIFRRAAGKRRSACFAASRYHLGRGARRALCPHGGRLCAPVGKGAALGGRGRAAGGRRFAQPAGIRFFGAALSGCVPAQRDFVFYAGSLPFRAIEVMLLFRKAHKYFMLHEQAQGSTP